MPMPILLKSLSFEEKKTYLLIQKENANKNVDCHKNCF